MIQIFLTGAEGFIGSNLTKSFSSRYLFIPFIRNQTIDLRNAAVVIHLAGKAHDLKKVLSIDEYYKANTDLTKEIFDAFLASNASVFITLSSVKAVTDVSNLKLTEDAIPNPTTHYGKSKLLAEEYIISQVIPEGKRVYILRPCMIHGPGNKGNLNLLYSLVSKGFPWPLGQFVNFRSYLSIDNFCFIINELINRENIPSGIYNLADDIPLSTNEVIQMIGESKGRKVMIINFGKSFITYLARVGDILKLPFNTERLQKLTESFVVSNNKINFALGKPLPVSSKEGLKRTFKSFSSNVG
jgi:nucleoside-diphosphate-sugar epimerase